MRFVGFILVSVFLLSTVRGGASAEAEEVNDQDRAHWAFQPMKRPRIPEGFSPFSPIDAFVQESLRTRNLSLGPPAAPRELIRRIYFDLIGLPPSPEAVEAFENSNASDNYEKIVDRLLALPQYGERWGRHWLDLARFAQSNGYERDGEKPFSWRYRDYVIDSFNADKPYDRFIIEQLAGDEMAEATADSVVATAFQRLGVWDDEPDDKRMAEFDALDDVVSTTSSTFLGLTLGCARCHDHKADPIPQSDYYSFLAFFRGVRPYENARTSFDSPGFAPLAAPREVRRWQSERKAALLLLQERLAAVKDDAEKKRLDGEIKKINEDVPFAWTLGVRERGPSPPATHVLARGNPESPGAEVKPAFLRVLDSSPPVLPVSDADAPTSGRRLALAQWIASPTNPLTARVLVNRIWQHHFGQGLVRTPSDFGRSGTTPTHPELLDWLATEFIESGWSLKKLHRTILLSQVYRQSSRANREPAAKIDPDNRLLWRQNLRRLEAEALRDSILSLAGTLNLQMAGRGFFPHLGGEILAGQSRPGLDWEVSSEAEKNRRSIYAFVRRTMAVPFLESFDYNNTTSPLAERVTTTVAPQALLLLNDSFLQDQAAAFARRLRLEAGSGLPAQIQRAYKLALQRSPTQRELTLAGEFLQRQTDAFKALASRISFQLDVASALATDYFTKLPSTEFLVGPRAGWSYYRGFWAPPYEGIRVVDRARAPFALWNDISYKDGTITATLQLASSSEFAGLLFRTVTADDVARGYEVIFDPRQEQIVLRRHDGKWVDLATAPAHLSWLEPIQVEIESSGPKIRISLEDDPQPMLEIIDDTPILEAGRVGIRTWGGAVSVDRWVISTVSFAGASSSMISAGTESPQDQALQSFCLLILNLNEIAYVD